MKRLDSDPVAQPADTMPGPRTGRHASAQGGPAQLGQERFFDRKHVGLVRVGRATQSAPLEQPLQAARKLPGNPQDLSVLRRIERQEAHFLRIIGAIDTVERQDMEVHVQVEGIAETLDERHGARVRVADLPLLARPSTE